MKEKYVEGTGVAGAGVSAVLWRGNASCGYRSGRRRGTVVGSYIERVGLTREGVGDPGEE
jgi:hypothetical protein